MDRKRRVIFRADGDSRVGLGHVVRSLALVHMLRDEFECVFAVQAPSKELQEQIKEVCGGTVMLPRCAPAEDRYTHELDAYVSEEEIVVLDGYAFGTAYQESIKSKGAALVCIDDIHAYRFVADAVINQAGGVGEDVYQAAPYTKVYLGPAYALLRPPFLAASNGVRSFPEGNLRVLLNLGGADPGNITLQLAKELRAANKALQVEIVVGGAYRHQAVLQAWLQNQPGFTLHRDLDAARMCSLMQACAVAVTSASGVAYEYAAVGGLLHVLKTADNQEDLHGYLLTSGIAEKYEGLQERLSALPLQEAFEEQVATQRRHLDGRSPERLRGVFRSLSLGAGLRIREAAAADLLLLLEWANDPEVRRHSFNPGPIPLEEHTRWFNAALGDEAMVLYIAEAEGKPAAHIRFKVDGGTAVVSYLVAADFRGRGLGHTVLMKGVAQLKRARPGVRQVQGLVQGGNTASVRAFEKAGFEPGEADAEHPGSLCFVQRLR